MSQLKYQGQAPKNYFLNYQHKILYVAAVTMRIFVFTNPTVNNWASTFLFSTKVSAWESVKESNFMSLNFSNSTDYHSEHISYFLYKLLASLSQNPYLGIILFSLFDILNARILTKNASLFNSPSIQEPTISIAFIYLLNPITVLSCTSFNLSSLYLLLLLMPFTISKSLLVKYLIMAFSSFINPNYSIIIVAYGVYEAIINGTLKQMALYFGLGGVLTSLAHLSMNCNLFSPHYNYYMMSDTNPNVGLLWGIINETFLKFRGFSIQMMILYQLLIFFCICNLFIYLRTSEMSFEKIESSKQPNKSENENSNPIQKEKEDQTTISNVNFKKIYDCSNSICFTLLFTANLICDRYPSENQIVALACLAGVHFHLLRTPYLTLGVGNLFFINSRFMAFMQA